MLREIILNVECFKNLKYYDVEYINMFKNYKYILMLGLFSFILYSYYWIRIKT